MTEPKAELVAAIDKLTKLSAEDRKIAYSEFVKVHGPAKAQELLEAAKAGDLFQAKAAEITAKVDVAEKAEASNFLPPVVKPDPEPLPSGEVPKPGLLDEGLAVVANRNPNRNLSQNRLRKNLRKPLLRRLRESMV